MVSFEQTNKNLEKICRIVARSDIILYELWQFLDNQEKVNVINVFELIDFRGKIIESVQFELSAGLIFI